MVILKSIGAFFVRIWRWIKETAWVQPLLIVGAIFAIIFSIPSITKAIDSWSASNTAGWLLNYRYSLDGEVFESDDATEADKLTKKVYNATRYAYGLDDSSKSVFDEMATSETKFFLVYFNSTSSDASNITSTFKYLQENWDNANYGLGLNDDKDLSFNVKVIYTDEESDNDQDFESKNNPSAFSRYLSVFNDFFAITSEVLYDRPYRINASIEESKYDAFGCNSTSSTDTDFSSSFPKPTILLCDFTDKAVSAGTAGVSQIAFSLPGSDNLENARFLCDMWNHTNDRSMDPDNNFIARN